MATIFPPTYPLPPKPQLKARAPKLANRFSEQHPSQIGPIHGPLAHAQDRALKLYDKHLAKKFPDPTPVEASASKVIEPSYHKWSLTICDGCFDTLKSSKMRS